MIEKLYQKAPCANCSFRKDAMRGWLGSERMKQILKSQSFTCHKTNKGKQCAGHMLIKGNENEFVRHAERFGIDLDLKGREKVFDTKDDCIEHHKK